MLFLVAASASLAASPGGFRTGPMLPVDEVAVREIATLGPDDTLSSHTTLVTRFGTDLLTGSVEVPVALAGGPGWFGWGMGNPRFGALFHLDPSNNLRVAAGVEVATVFPATSVQATSWGSHRREASYGTEGLLVLGFGTLDDAPLSFKADLGVRGGPYYDGGILIFNWSPVADLSVVKVQPVAARVALVGEAELAVDRVPFSARAMVRLELAPLFVDLGMQGILPTYGLPLPSLVTQVKGRF